MSILMMTILQNFVESEPQLTVDQIAEMMNSSDGTVFRHLKKIGKIGRHALKFQTELYGTVNLNRKEMPQELVKKKIAKNENIAFRQGKVIAMKWKEKKDVTVLFTVHTNDMVDVQYHNKVIRKPIIVTNYNKNMGAVDIVD
ncbi:hypothetical protein TNIN_401121 [Trichonephila inaurata madagascariensis]|uniref:PiggyBac transposable element-derived protein domain-containing protein n=1 Tax=Trichonephila inaurata madagascariensis TaxID=2747483 RepID=A0A8X6WRP4_9ARAC|nr:hypothetical protein TNIN_401121 [Trichonephila inaurata madagascariensis]